MSQMLSMVENALSVAAIYKWDVFGEERRPLFITIFI